MSILYRKEHSLCKEYASPGRAIFEVYRFRKDEDLPNKIMDYTAIVFVLEGRILANCGSFLNYVINSGCILMIPNGMKISGVALEDTLILRCIFNIEGHLCNRYSIESLTEFIDLDKWEYQFDLLPICERLSEFVSLLIRCLDDGLGCFHFHQWKREELMLMFRGYYTKEDLAHFFYPVLSANWDINSFVLNHYKKANDVNELADMAHLSLVTFNRHFKKAFGETAARWLEETAGRGPLERDSVDPENVRGNRPGIPFLVAGLPDHLLQAAFWENTKTVAGEFPFGKDAAGCLKFEIFCCFFVKSTFRNPFKFAVLKKEIF